MPIRTDDVHGKARIREIETEELDRRMEDGEVPVVAGFQGLGPDNRITTLGRGGSDTSAVALAAALKADRCDIYTDVDGVYTTDPRIVAKARKLDKITYEEMLELASQGAKVLQTRSVEMAMNHRVRVQVLSSFSRRPAGNAGRGRGRDRGTGSRERHRLQPRRGQDDADAGRRPAGRRRRDLRAAGRAAINVDMIVQNVSEDGKLHRPDLHRRQGRSRPRGEGAGRAARRSSASRRSTPDSNVVKISVIGVGMRSHAGVAQQMFQALAEKGINIQVISTSEIKVSVLIAEEYTELALRALHTAYGLDAS